MAGRKKKSELEVHHETEIKKIFSRQFRKACQKGLILKKKLAQTNCSKYMHTFSQKRQNSAHARLTKIQLCVD